MNVVNLRFEEDLYFCRSISGFHSEYLYQSNIEYKIFGCGDSYSRLMDVLLLHRNDVLRIAAFFGGMVTSAVFVPASFLNKESKIAFYEKPSFKNGEKYMELIVFMSEEGRLALFQSISDAGRMDSSGGGHIHIDHYARIDVVQTGVVVALYNGVNVINLNQSAGFPEDIEYMYLEEEGDRECLENIENICSVFPGVKIVKGG